MEAGAPPGTSSARSNSSVPEEGPDFADDGRPALAALPILP